MLNGRKPPRVVTSFNEEGYEKYGKGFVETFLAHWPKEIGLTVYYEGEAFEFTEGVSWHPYESVEFLADFLDGLRFPIMTGRVGDRYDINFDAFMARKAFIEKFALSVKNLDI